MTDASVIGAGMIRFGRYPNASYSDLAVPAIIDAIRMAETERVEIDAVYCGHSYGGMLTGQRICKSVGLDGRPIFNIENACSGGASAFAEAVAAISAGHFRMVLVVGVDKLTQFPSGTIPLNQEDHEVSAGLTMPGLYAMRAQRYLHEHNLGPEVLAQVCVKSRAHASRNPYAQLTKVVTIDDVLRSRMIATPLTLYQCCPSGDGAAALVVTNEARASAKAKRYVKVLSSAVTSGKYNPGFRDMTSPEITKRCATEAYNLAGLGPEDIDVAEVHDAFTIAELLYYESLGFCDRGRAAELLWSGGSSIGGRISVNPSGGLLSKGHPIGASGVAQIVELTWQLLGMCGDRQVAKATVGMSHVTGGGISGFDHGACAIHVLGR